MSNIFGKHEGSREDEFSITITIRVLITNDSRIRVHGQGIWKPINAEIFWDRKHNRLEYHTLCRIIYALCREIINSYE